MVIEEINEVFETVEQINVYSDGVKISYRSGEQYFGEILETWNNMIEGSRDMPAFGVSINRETVKAMRSGLWVEFIFSEIMEVNGMPFEKLAVNVEREYSGFNLHRFNTCVGYDGRCYYIDLINKDMSEFYKKLTNLV